jgi:hypothetical protein
MVFRYEYTSGNDALAVKEVLLDGWHMLLSTIIHVLALSNYVQSMMNCGSS